jgi:hypothetical protein
MADDDAQAAAIVAALPHPPAPSQGIFGDRLGTGPFQQQTRPPPPSLFSGAAQAHLAAAPQHDYLYGA